MIRFEEGTVLQVLTERTGLCELEVSVAGKTEKAIQFLEGSAPISPGDKVMLNTTAVRLGLGSGGYHFVVPRALNAIRTLSDNNTSGHIMKLRYTPAQFSVLSCEEPQHPAHSMIEGQDSLHGMPVIAAELHSMLPVITAVIHHAYELHIARLGGLHIQSPRIAYIMTDGGALPLALSKNCAELKQKQLLAGTVTVGNAYGGDLEAVTVYSGLLAAKYILHADIAIVAMGPGIVGTGTQFGHTGIEQGQTINAVGSMQGTPIACPRISFADERARHHGLSHHTITALGQVALTRALLPFPLLNAPQMQLILKQLHKAALNQKHAVSFHEASLVQAAAARYDVRFSTMGRNYSEDPAFFLAAGAASLLAFDIWQNARLTISADRDIASANKHAT